MGSQRIAKISSQRSSRIAKFAEQTDQKGDDTIASDIASVSVGPFSKTSSFIQCLSNQSITNALEFLIDFQNEFAIKKSSPDKVFNNYGINPDNKHPLGTFALLAQKHLMEVLAAQQRPTESAIAVNDALTQSLIEIMAKHMPRSEIRSSSRDKIAEIFKREHPRDITKIMLKNVIANLINRIVDAASGSLSPKRSDRIKANIREHFALKLANEIDRLARKKGVLPSKIPSHISQWVEELEELRKEYAK